MTIRSSCIILSLAVAPACGSRRVAGYLEEFESWSETASEPGETDTTQGPGSSAAPDSSDSDGSTTTHDPDTTTGTTDVSTSTSTTGETAGASSGEPTALCGNGILEASGPVPEECDDGNLDAEDGCSDTCAVDRRVFVTSKLYNAGELQSLELADTLCANLADDQGWPDGLQYLAWLSDSTTDARDRFKRGRGRLVLPNGLLLANSWDALLAGELLNPFEVTEKSETYHGPVWTGTQPDGTLVPGADNCEDWSSDSFLLTAYYGYSNQTSGDWTMAAVFDNPISCISDNAIYCLQTL